MANEPETEVIRLQMEAQRASLTEKLETLENKIVNSVDEAREAVADTVQSVKESVDTVKEGVTSSVDSVKDAFDIRRQTERHPWVMFGGSMAVGVVAGCLLNRTLRAPITAPTSAAPPSYTAAPFVRPAGRVIEPAEMAATAAPASQSPGKSWMQDVAQTFAPELGKLKGIAIGALMGVVRDLVSESMPESMRPQVAEIADSITAKLGGEPMKSDMVDEILPKRRDDLHNGRHRTAEDSFRH